MRELENAVHRALVANEGGRVRPEDLPSRIRKVKTQTQLSETANSGLQPAESPTKPSGGPDAWPFENLELEALERAAVLEALRRSGGNVTQAMRALGIGRTTLYRKLKHYGIEPES